MYISINQIYVHLDAILHESLTISCELALSKPDKTVNLNDIKLSLKKILNKKFSERPLISGLIKLNSPSNLNFKDHQKMLEVLEADKAMLNENLGE